MAKELAGKDISLWIDTTAKTNFRSLPKTTRTFDVAVAGGGIAGILTAWTLQKKGISTAIIEKNRIVENTTGNTTAKLTSQHSLVYSFLIKEHGKRVAQAYADANEQGIEDIEALTRSLGIECDFTRRDAFVYTQQAERLKDIKDEVKAAKSLNLPASFVSKIDLPYLIKGAVKFEQQAQFHPRKFLMAMAEDFTKAGGRIFENVEVQDIKPGKISRLITEKGELKARNIVGATKYPFWRTEIFEDHTWTKLSYALGVKLKDGQKYPQGMYISTDHPIRTMRSHPYKKGEILIFGGESHEMTKDYNKDEHYQNLIDDVRSKFKLGKVVYRWIAGDVMPYDHLPYIGRYPGEKNIYIITGFHAWGLAWAMAAAKIVSDLITGKTNRSAQFFSPARLKS